MTFYYDFLRYDFFRGAEINFGLKRWIIFLQFDKKTDQDDLGRKVDDRQQGAAPSPHRRSFTAEEKAFLERRKKLRKNMREGFIWLFLRILLSFAGMSTS